MRVIDSLQPDVLGGQTGDGLTKAVRT